MSSVGTLNESNRIAWLEKVLKQIPAGSRILDAGAGEQQFKKFCSHLDYVAQDFGKYDGKGDNSGLQKGRWDQTNLDIISDITSIPETASSFNAIMCTEVFEHLPNPVSAIKEFHRLLKPDGRLIITSPFCSLTHFAPYHFYSGFNRYFYLTHLTANNFEILEMEANGNYFEYMGQELRRIESVAKKYAHGDIGLIGRRAIHIVLKILGGLSKRDNGSDELLCFGYHILAKKT